MVPTRHFKRTVTEERWSTPDNEPAPEELDDGLDGVEEDLDDDEDRDDFAER